MNRKRGEGKPAVHLCTGRSSGSRREKSRSGRTVVDQRMEGSSDTEKYLRTYRENRYLQNLCLKKERRTIVLKESKTTVLFVI